jgi:hypothetical protein
LDNAWLAKRVDRNWRAELIRTGIHDRLRDWRAMLWDKVQAGDYLAAYFSKEIDGFI